MAERNQFLVNVAARLSLRWREIEPCGSILPLYLITEHGQEAFSLVS
jgi:hypothetical protein